MLKNKNHCERVNELIGWESQQLKKDTYNNLDESLKWQTEEN